MSMEYPLNFAVFSGFPKDITDYLTDIIKI